jgi:hypothetical protein
MSDAPKFEVIDRRRAKAAEEEQESRRSALVPEEPEAKVPAEAKVPVEAAAPAAASNGPRLVTTESRAAAAHAPEENLDAALEGEPGAELPPMPTPQEISEQKVAYELSAQRLEELIRAQNPAMGPQPPVTFQHLVQQFYVSAMIQMGAGAQEGQRPRVDIVGARTTIDLLNVLEEKTRGHLNATENRALQTVLFEARIAFNELTGMINLQAMQAPQPPPPGKR